MFTLLRANTLRAIARQRTTFRAFASKDVQKKPDEEEDAVSPVTLKRQEMSKKHKYMVWGTGDNDLPAPVLPEKPSEIAKLDPEDERFRNAPDGTPRTVVIRQEEASTRQAPLEPEKSWRIFFYEDGMTAHKWENSLMGWSSNADPYQCGPPLTFPNAADAVYFAKKRGWNYTVQRPILRVMRDDDAQYQDNFLPQAVANKVRREGTACKQWERDSSCTSHYLRPLKYHGDGTVGQFGPNPTQPIEPHVQGIYKMR